MNLTFYFDLCYDRCAFQKRRGVNVKAKLKLLVVVLPTIVIIFSAYLCLRNSTEWIREYESKARSTANYLQIEEELTQNLEQEAKEEKEDNVSKEEIALEILDENIDEEEVKTDTVYDGLTLEQLSNKLNSILNSTVSGI